jgi:hypothetical protein
MVNDLIMGIGMALEAEFGDDYTIYREEIKQDLQKPCFYISQVLISRNPTPNHMERTLNSFDIHYFPQSKNYQTEIRDIEDRMFDALEIITLANGDKARGTSRRAEKHDGVLHFFVDYNMNRRLVESVDTMQTLTVEMEVTGWQE